MTALFIGHVLLQDVRVQKLQVCVNAERVVHVRECLDALIRLDGHVVLEGNHQVGVQSTRGLEAGPGRCDGLSDTGQGHLAVAAVNLRQSQPVAVDEVNDGGANIEVRGVSAHIFQIALCGVDEGTLVHA